MHSFLRRSLSVACLSLAWIPAAQSTPSGRKWIPRNLDMQNMVVDLGMDKFTGSGSECRLQDFSNEPVLSFTNVQQNQTYLAAALSFLADNPITANSSESGAFDPAKVLQETSRSPIYLSYLQTSMHKRATASTILSSEVDPLVPFKLPAISSCGQSIVFIAFVFAQPHPLLVEECYTRDFSGMKDDVAKRGDYNFAEFWKSAALGDILAATWITIGNDKAGCSNGGGQGNGTATEGKGGAQIVSVTTDSVSPPGATAEAAIGATDETITITTTITADGKLAVITPTVVPASSFVGGENGVFVGGRVGQESPALNGQNKEATITTVISTTDKEGKPTIITITIPSATAAAAVAPPSSSRITGSDENGKKGKKASDCDSTTTTTTTTTTTATSTITRAGNSPPPIVASASQTSKPESGSFITSVKTATITTTNAQGSPTTELITTTVTSTVLNLQAPGGGTAGAVQNDNGGFVNGDGGFVNGTAAPSRSSQSPPLRSSTTLLLATTTATTALKNNNNGTGTTSTTAGAGKISAPPSSPSPSQPPPVQAGASDAQPRVMVLSACLLGGLGMIYFAFL